MLAHVGGALQYGTLSYELKTPYKDGTTHVVFEPLDFIARLAALVPKPRVHLIRFHGIFAPNSKQREEVTREAAKKKKRVKLEAVGGYSIKPKQNDVPARSSLLSKVMTNN